MYVDLMKDIQLCRLFTAMEIFGTLSQKEILNRKKSILKAEWQFPLERKLKVIGNCVKRKLPCKATS